MLGATVSLALACLGRAVAGQIYWPFDFGVHDGKDWQVWGMNGSNIYRPSVEYVGGYLHERWPLQTYSGGFYCSLCAKYGIFEGNPVVDGKPASATGAPLVIPQNFVGDATRQIDIQWSSHGYHWKIVNADGTVNDGAEGDAVYPTTDITYDAFWEDLYGYTLDQPRVWQASVYGAGGKSGGHGIATTPLKVTQMTVQPSGPPLVTSQPQNASVASGTTADFGVAASNAPTSYQWQMKAAGATMWSPLTDGAKYSGSQTATLAVKSAVPAGPGGCDQVRCVVTNAAGSAASQPASLIVTNALLLNGLRSAPQELVPTESLQEAYDRGTKHLLSIEGGLTVLDSFTCAKEYEIDLDDYFGATPEGRQGWVTVWVTNNINIGAGIAKLAASSLTGGAVGPDFNVGVSEFQYDHSNPDPDLYSVAGPSVAFYELGFDTVSWSSTNVDGTLGTPGISFKKSVGTDEFSLSVLDERVQSAKYEVQRATLDQLLNTATTSVVRLGMVATPVEAAKIFANAIESLASIQSAQIRTGAAVSYDDGAPIAPTIVESPSSQHNIGISLYMATVKADGTLPLTYQWYQGAKGDTSRLFATRTLTVSIGREPFTAGLDETVSVWVRVSNAFGHADSEAATFSTTSLGQVGTYFGTFANNAGQWALLVTETGAAKFIGYANGGQRLFSDTILVNADGTFTTTVRSQQYGREAKLRALSTAETISGQISNGNVAGQVIGTGLAFSGSIDGAPIGFSASSYTAQELGPTAGSAQAIVGPSGRALVVVSGEGQTDAAFGTIAPDRKLSGTTVSGAKYSIALGSDSSLSVSITQDGSPPTTFLGTSDSSASTTRIINLSTRTTAGTGSNVLIAGFSISGSGQKHVLVRGIGPGLLRFGVSDALTNPVLAIFNSTPSKIAENAAWGGAPKLAAVFSSVGAFTLPSESSDTAIYGPFNSGSYTAQVSGADKSTGEALIELYDTDSTDSETQLTNISARAVAGGSNVLIAGFVLSGVAPAKVLVRGIGPSLAQFGIFGAMQRPMLRISNAAGATLYSNTGWAGDPLVATAFSQVGAFGLPTDSKDSALLVTLPPGMYTAQLTSADGGTGIALVEVYRVP